MAAKGWKFYRFAISRTQFHAHHPLQEAWPNWTIKLPASCHSVVSAWMREEVSDKNLADLRAFIDSLEMVYLEMRRVLDEQDVQKGEQP